MRRRFLGRKGNSVIVNAENPTNYYRLNETSLTNDAIAVDSISGRNGAAFNMNFGTGKVSGAYIFNGTSSNIVLPVETDLQFTDSNGNDVPFTLRCWVNFAATGDRMLLNKIHASDNSNREWFLYALNGSLMFNIQDSTGNNIRVNYPFSKSLNVWYHITATYDGSGVKEGMNLYINGVNVGDKTATGIYTKMPKGNIRAKFGMHSNLTNVLTLNGILDEIGIWKGYSLNSSEVLSDYTELKTF